MARGLGKGLESLIPGAEKASAQTEKPSAKKEAQGKEIVKEVVKEVIREVKVNEPLLVKLRDIEPNRNQPRKEFDEEALAELAASISRYGVVVPLIVIKKGKRYEIIAGERRWRAAKLAGIKEVPVIVKDYSEQEVSEVALIENLQREDLNPVEEANAYRSLAEQYGLKQEEIAEKVSKSRAYIANSLRLLKLNPDVLEMLASAQISSGHAKVLLALENGEQQKEAAVAVFRENLSVRQTEKYVKNLLSEKKTAKPEFGGIQEYEKIREALCEKLGTKVNINRKAENKGRLEIDYYSFEELERILELLGAYGK